MLSYYDMRLQKDLLTAITMNAENRVAIQFAMAIPLNKMMHQIKTNALDMAAHTPDYLQQCHHLAVAHFISIWEKESNEALATIQEEKQ